MASALDSFNIPDPNALLAQQNQQIDKGLTGTLSDRGAALGQLFGRMLVGNPAVAQAQQVRQAASDAMSSVGPQGNDESDLTYQLRQARAMHDAVAPYDPNAAMQLADRIVTLHQAQQQQDLLSTRESGEKQEQLLRAENIGRLVVGSPDFKQSYGTISRFMPDGVTPNPDFDAQRKALLDKNPGALVTTQQGWDTAKASLAEAAIKMEGELKVAKAKALAQIGGPLTEDLTKSNIEAYAVHGPSAWNRLPPAERNAARMYMTAVGLHENDLLAAYNEAAAVKAEGVAAAHRVGNIDVLQNSLAPLGQNLVEAAQNVDRGRLSIINAAVRAGHLSFNDPNERRFALALNAFDTEYARAMSGGTGITQVGAREDTKALLPPSSDLAAIKAAVDQVVNKELASLKQAGDQALEVVANPQKYKALVKVQQALWKDDPRAGGLIDYDTRTAAAKTASGATVTPAPVTNKVVKFSDLAAQ